MAAIPARLGRYRLLEHVASGGMADVFRAKSVGIAGFEKILAIKLIRPNIAQEARFIRSFVDEARIAVTLNHRNIVQVFDFGKAEHRLYIAMELIEGIDLRAALGAAKKAGYDLPASIACYIVADLAAGLDYAHRKTDNEGRSLGIVHCDVSPHNVMLSYEGFIKILDFGVARARFATTPEERRLRGKPRYMAPEQTRGEIPTPATDSFALGIVAWELFTGLPLFEGADIKEILRAVRRADTPAVRKLNPDVPRYLSDSIDSALRADPQDRVRVGELAENAARAARELATVASSRALADWLALIRPGGEPLPPPVAPPAGMGESGSFGDFDGVSSTAQVSASSIKPPAPDAEPTEPPSTSPRSTSTAVPAQGFDVPEVGTRTNIIVASDLMAGDDSITGTSRSEAFDVEPTGTGSDEPPTEASTDAPAPIAEKLLREKRHVVATCALLEGGNPEISTELVRLLAELAYKRGAVIQEQGDDTLSCVFGLEVAGEDDVASAMQYSLDATELVRETTRQSGGSDALGVRIGSRAGVVAQRRADGIHIRGSGLEDARTLARAAEPGHPLLSGGAGRLASAQFAFRELTTRRTGSRRLRAFELLGPRSFAERARVLTERRGRFVGRRDELGKMTEVFERAQKESSQLALALVGPGGVGKSRLVAEFVARHPETPFFAVAANQSSSQAPFSVLIDLLQAGLGLPPGRGPQARAQLARRLEAGLESLPSGERDATLDTLNEAMEMRDGALLRPVQATPGFRERVTAAFRKVRQQAFSGPLIIVIENLHWADAASVEVLRTTSSGGEGDPALVIVTSRPREELREITSDAALVLTISDLEGEERDALIRDRLGGGVEASSDSFVAGLVASRAGGNPLMIEEVCTAVREFGPDRIPNNARDIVLARVDALPVPVKTALQHASVAAPTIRSPILEELLGPQTPAHLGELIEEGLLVASDYAAQRGDASELRFRHGLIQEVVYESLSATGKRRAHRELGELLATRSDAGRDERPAEVATHLERGDRPTEAARFWLRAGRLSLAAFDADGAAASFDNAVRLAGEDKSIIVGALLGRESARGVVGDHDAQAADQERLLALAGDDAGLLADIKWRIAGRLLRVGAYPEAIVASEEAEAAAARAGDERLAGEALLVRGEIYERSGDYVKGLNAVTAATELFHRIGNRDGEMRSLVVRGRNCLTRSRYRAARDAYEPVLRRLESESDPLLERMVRNHLAVIELCSGNFEAAMSSVKRSVEICEELGDRARVGDNISVCGIILLAVGQYEEAAEYLDRALAILEETKSRWSVCDCKLYRGVCATLLGDDARGIELLEESVSEARELGARYVIANALTELAGVLLRRDEKGDSRAAEAATREAHELAREAALTGIEVLALSRHAEATVRLGNTMSAVALSTRAVDLLAEQDGIEGPEEEIYYTHCQLLRRMGKDKAEDYLELARKSLEEKLAGFSNQAWKRSFSERVAVNAAILLES